MMSNVIMSHCFSFARSTKQKHMLCKKIREKTQYIIFVSLINRTSNDTCKHVIYWNLQINVRTTLKRRQIYKGHITLIFSSFIELFVFCKRAHFLHFYSFERLLLTSILKHFNAITVLLMAAWNWKGTHFLGNNGGGISETCNLIYKPGNKRN